MPEPTVSRSVQKHVERSREIALEIGTLHNGIKKAVLQKKLAALETLGQFLTNRLFDDSRTGETDQGSRFSDVQISEHGEARRNTACRRVGQNADIRQPGF